MELAINHGLRARQLAEVLKLIDEHLDDIGTLGRRISQADVTNVSRHGFWLFVEECELFVPFTQFPWFRDASIGAIANVQYPSPHHLYWPDLDIDLAVESIEHPEKYPLVSKVQTHDVGQPPRRTKKTKGKKPRRP